MYWNMRLENFPQHLVTFQIQKHACILKWTFNGLYPKFYDMLTGFRVPTCSIELLLPTTTTPVFKTGPSVFKADWSGCNTSHGVGLFPTHTTEFQPTCQFLSYNNCNGVVDAGYKYWIAERILQCLLRSLSAATWNGTKSIGFWMDWY